METENPYISVGAKKKAKKIDIGGPTNSGGSTNPNNLEPEKAMAEDKNTSRLNTIKTIVEARNQFRAAGAGGARGGGVIHKGTRGARKSPVTMQKKAITQVAKGVKKAGVSQKQAAAIAIAKQRASGNIAQVRQKNSQYRIN